MSRRFAQWRSDTALPPWTATRTAGAEMPASSGGDVDEAGRPVVRGGAVIVPTDAVGSGFVANKATSLIRKAPNAFGASGRPLVAPRDREIPAHDTARRRARKLHPTTDLVDVDRNGLTAAEDRAARSHRPRVRSLR